MGKRKRGSMRRRSRRWECLGEILHRDDDNRSRWKRSEGISSSEYGKRSLPQTSSLLTRRKMEGAAGCCVSRRRRGNVFRNARVTCIAGPCPFTRIDTDGFSIGGHNIKVLIRNWSDTATFVLQADVFRTQVSDIVRESSPVIFGRAMNFTLPAKAEGPSIEAEMNGSRIVFPLGPTPVLSWADCNVRIEKNQVKDYRCELKAGYQY